MRTALEDRKNNGADSVEMARRALAAVAHLSIGGALMLVSAVVVLTMVTQAFSFEAIRFFEGYWGTSRPMEWFADRRCRHFAEVVISLDDRITKATDRAWERAEAHFAATRKLARERKTPIGLTEELTQILEAQVKGKLPLRATTVEEDGTLERANWQGHSDRSALRRKLNLETRRRDYPSTERLLPTNLGNVLRSAEDEYIEGPIEPFIQRVFDELPVSLQVEHDQQRTRLDLYCSMVVVVAVVSMFAVALMISHVAYAIAAVIVGGASAWLSYRAAIASARAYGGLVGTIAERIARQ